MCGLHDIVVLVYFFKTSKLGGSKVPQPQKPIYIIYHPIYARSFRFPRRKYVRVGPLPDDTQSTASEKSVQISMKPRKLDKTFTFNGDYSALLELKVKFQQLVCSFRHLNPTGRPIRFLLKTKKKKPEENRPKKL
jgi:hypothetical protein